MADDPEPPSKKFRSIAEDLTVVLQYQDDSGKQHQKEYLFYSEYLCPVCGVVDRALASNMQEQKTHRITMECPSPKLFKLAIQSSVYPFFLLVDSKPVPRLEMHQALALARFLDQYEFRLRTSSICDEVISKAIFQTFHLDNDASVADHWEHLCRDLAELPGTPLDELLHILMILFRCNLQLSQRRIIDYMTELMRTKALLGLFELRHIEELHPLIQEGFFLEAIEPISFTQDKLSDSATFPATFLSFLKADCKRCMSVEVESYKNPIYVRNADGKGERVNGKYNFVERSVSSLGWWSLKYEQEVPDGSASSRLKFGAMGQDGRLYPKRWRLFIDSHIGQYYASRRLYGAVANGCTKCCRVPSIITDQNWDYCSFGHVVIAAAPLVVSLHPKMLKTVQRGQLDLEVTSTTPRQPFVRSSK